jgi:hypothetical protein
MVSAAAGATATIASGSAVTASAASAVVGTRQSLPNPPACRLSLLPIFLPLLAGLGSLFELKKLYHLSMRCIEAGTSSTIVSQIPTLAIAFLHRIHQCVVFFCFQYFTLAWVRLAAL